MDRRQSLQALFSLFALSLMSRGGESAAADRPVLDKSKAEWAKLLPPAAYNVLFEEGTERAGTSPLNGEKRDGTFVCAA